MTSNESLWPKDLVDGLLTPPGDILKEQAAMLGEMTNKLIQAVVEEDTAPDNDWNSYELTLVAPALDNYEYKLLRVTHRFAFYPCDFYNMLETDTENEHLTCLSENNLKVALARLFPSSEARGLIRTLITRCTIAQNSAF